MLQKKGGEERDSISIVTESEGTDDLLIVLEEPTGSRGSKTSSKRSVECGGSKGAAAEFEVQLRYRRFQNMIETQLEIGGCRVMVKMQSRYPGHTTWSGAEAARRQTTADRRSDREAAER